MVDIQATVAGNLQAGGAQVNITGPAANVRAGGLVVTLRGPVSGDADLAGAVVTVDTSVKGRLRAAGGTVTLGSTTDVGGDLYAAGGVVIFAGHVAGDANFGAGTVTINGRVDKSVKVGAGRVIVGPQAVIAGDLIVRSLDDPVVETGATITGKVLHEPLMIQWWLNIPPWQWHLIFAAVVVLGTLLAAIVAMIFGPRAFVEASENARLRPISSILLGLLTLILIPVVGAILIGTVIGISIGFALLLFIPLLVVVGHAVAAAGVGGWILRRSAIPPGILALLFFVLVGAIIIALVSLVPWVGPWFAGAAVLLGTGGFARTLGARVRRPQPQPTL
jgi:cytoskeletal protein CcmA (bactofilin family)